MNNGNLNLNKHSHFIWKGLIVKILYNEQDSGVYYISTPHGTTYKLGFYYLSKNIRTKLTHKERKYAVSLILDARKNGNTYKKHLETLRKKQHV